MKFLIFIAIYFCAAITLAAENSGTAESGKPNQELPKILYVIPWKDVENGKNVGQKLVLNDFFGDLYDPVLPSSLVPEKEIIVEADGLKGKN